MTRKQKINIFAICLLGFITTFSVLSFIKGPHEIKPTISNRVLSDTNNSQPPLLKIMTLNLAHGRKDGFHQVLQRKATIESNLKDIATVLQREQPAVVAFQEADGPSWWSGNFNHVHYLADQANYAYAVQGEHVKGLGLSYGTALLSKLPLKDAASLTFFTYTPPTPAKGFLVSTLDTGIKINLVSVHLDFARSSVRRQQIEEMVNYLKPRGKPLIIMGDFNCEWTSETTLPLLAEQLNLHVYQPTATLMNTFPQPTKETRIDWILISAELEFVTYQVMEDILSDHLGVIATLKVK
jgi:endonuclease/exonuclease/phosphatase family metal-dependent hydrolase